VKNAFYLILLMATACHHFREQSLSETSAAYDASELTVDTMLFRDAAVTSRESVKEFYSSRGNSMFWNSDYRFKPAADSLFRIIKNAGAFGLLPQDYHRDDIDALWRDTLAGNRMSRLDVLLTDSYLTLHRHLRLGRLDSRTLQRTDLAATPDHQAISSLEKVHTAYLTVEFGLIEPHSKPYRLLRTALQAFYFLGQEDSTQRRRAEKIALNMERWRWQKAWPDRCVYVNIPGFLLRVIENDSVWLQSKVIVGKRDTPTPVIESVIRSFIIYPYWHVPYSIATKEILPALQVDGSYLVRNNFEVLNTEGRVINADTIQWELYTADRFPFTLRQREGSENSMGIIKFNFANNYGVYLHDTNSKRLYGRARRDLSHGCVRVSDAVAFAHYLVREDDIYVSPEDLDQYLSFQQRLKIDLRKPIPLKLEYFTTEVENGVALFYDDIYRKDSVMMESLYRPHRHEMLARAVTSH
jgi:L,D-transpeptidase YcbB